MDSFVIDGKKSSHKWHIKKYRLFVACQTQSPTIVRSFRDCVSIEVSEESAGAVLLWFQPGFPLWKSNHKLQCNYYTLFGRFLREKSDTKVNEVAKALLSASFTKYGNKTSNHTIFFGSARPSNFQSMLLKQTLNKIDQTLNKNIKIESLMNLAATMFATESISFVHFIETVAMIGQKMVCLAKIICQCL